MIVNSKWLEKYTDIPYSTEELEDRLTYLGLEAKIISNPVTDLKGIVISEILEVKKHPNADKLTVCRVNTGNDERDVICGAPNVEKGRKVPLVLPGSELPGGLKIKSMKLRGVQSDGMIPAEDELGISDDHDGIIILDDDALIGADFAEYYSEMGTNYDIDLTPNRPDCTSHIGVARDLTLLTENELNIPGIDIKESDCQIEKGLKVEIVDSQACPRYATRIIRNVKIGPSPKWIVDHLKSVGLRSINNIVDISNFVLMETGHPLHTFDFEKITSNEIVIRKSIKGEEVQTLDGAKHELSDDILLICNKEQPVAIAGIMGLQNSEISDSTKDIVIESAYFDPSTIRKGSKYLGLQTDASYRFERGADPEGVIYALNRITSLIQEIAGGEVDSGIIDQYPNVIEKSKVKLRFARINQLIGFDFDPEWIIRKFTILGCEITSTNENEVELFSPSWRPDLEREADYIEEAVRIHGMENIPSAKKLQILASREYNKRYELVEKLRSELYAHGLLEVYNNSLVSQEETAFALQDVKPVKLRNPLGQDMSYLRTTLIPGLLRNAKLNINRKNDDLQLFELGFIQEFDPDSKTMAKETLKFAILFTGNIEARYWKHKSRESNIFELKGISQAICKRFNISEINFDKAVNKYFKQLIKGEIEGKEFCHIGELKKNYLLKEWDIDKSVFIFEGNVEILFDYCKFIIKYSPLPVFPAIERDISILVSENTRVDQVSQIIRKSSSKLLKDLEFYDLYKDDKIEGNKKSLTFNLVFQTAERTLKDKEVDRIMKKVHNDLKRGVNAELR